MTPEDEIHDEMIQEHREEMARGGCFAYAMIIILGILLSVAIAQM